MTGLLEGIGHNIRRLRDEKGWNQTELGYRSDTSPSIISLVENGKRNPSTATLAKIARALDVEVVDLFPKKAQAPLPLDSPVRGAGDPAEAAAMIKSLASTAAELATAWNQDAELYEHHGRSLLPYRTLEMGLAVEALYEHFWGALSVLQQHAESLGHDANPAAWEPQLKELLIEAGSNIRALAELYALIDKTGRKPDADSEDFRAMREEFDMSPPAFLTEDPRWPEAIERARIAAGIT
jgi:transcriptional regulator with XRE-family HTH domain